MNMNHKRARTNEASTLQAIGSAGWLSASQLAKWVWDGPSHSARVSAERVLKRLAKAGLIKRRISVDGVFVYVLTHLGAAQANNEVAAPLYIDGYDLSQLDVYRQRKSVDYLIMHHKAGKTVFGAPVIRRAIQMGILTGVSGADGFVFDEMTGENQVSLVVRNVHMQLLGKARRLRLKSDLELLGEPGLIAAFQRELRRFG